MTYRAIILPLVLVGLLPSRTGATAQQLATRAARILWVPKHAAIESHSLLYSLAAENGRGVFADGSASVSFRMTGEREPLTSALVEHFAGTEWRPRGWEYLNPPIATSFKTGWRHLCACVWMTDSSGKPVPREPLYDWHGQWQNSHGDIVAVCIPKTPRSQVRFKAKQSFGCPRVLTPPLSR
jgi:hypothetical protein